MKTCRNRPLTDSELEKFLYDFDCDDSVSEVKDHLFKIILYSSESDNEFETNTTEETASDNSVN